MTKTKESWVTLDELHRIIIRCSRCGAEKCFDLAEPKHQARLHAGTPLSCDVCQLVHPMLLTNALHDLCLTYENWQQFQNVLIFCLPDKDEDREGGKV